MTFFDLFLHRVLELSLWAQLAAVAAAWWARVGWVGLLKAAWTVTQAMAEPRKKDKAAKD
jgi:hypothetical protein